jgi:hypothetical protein
MAAHPQAGPVQVDRRLKRLGGGRRVPRTGKELSGEPNTADRGCLFMARSMTAFAVSIRFSGRNCGKLIDFADCDNFITGLYYLIRLGNKLVVRLANILYRNYLNII